MTRNIFPITYKHPLGAPINPLYAEYIGNDIFHVYRDQEGKEPVVGRHEYDPTTFTETFTAPDGRRIRWVKVGNQLTDLRYRTGGVFVNLLGD